MTRRDCFLAMQWVILFILFKVAFLRPFLFFKLNLLDSQFSSLANLCCLSAQTTPQGIHALLRVFAGRWVWHSQRTIDSTTVLGLSMVVSPVMLITEV